MENESNKIWQKIIAKAWSDSEFKEKLLQNPNEVLKSFGLEIPKDMKINVLENDTKNFYLIIPKKPAGEINEEKLSQIAAGLSFGPKTKAE